MTWVLFVRQNTVKTAIRNSKINFYFVTCFYSLDDICMMYGDAVRIRNFEF